MKIRMPKLTRTYMRRKVVKSCPDPREHVKAALASGEGPEDCRHAGVMHDPRIARWYAAPKPRHVKVMPRWGGMNETPNGRVTSRMLGEGEDDSAPIHELDYASRAASWGK